MTRARSPRHKLEIPIEVGNGDVASFVAAITTLNAAGGGVIQLASNGQYSFTTPADWWYGPNALPAVTSAIVIEGNGSTLQRTTTDLAFRFFYVSGGFSSIPAGNLTLRNLTLTGGLAQGGKGGRGAYGGGGGAGLGGAIYNQGGVRLVGVILAQNAAKGGDGQQTGNEGASGGVVFPVTAAVLSAAKIRPRLIVPPPTWPGTSPRTSSLPS